MIICAIGIPLSAGGQTTGFRSNIGGYNFGGTASLGAYQTYGSIYLHLIRSARMEVIAPEDESRLYGHLLRRLIEPRYLLLQLSLYPLAGLSSSLETDRPSFYNRFYVLDSLNMLKSLGSGPEEPYALSLFLGNITVFARPAGEVASDAPKRRQSGSAVVGFQVSAGHWHIQDNIRINDRWFEPELRLKGSLNEPGVRRVSWNVHTGVKLHHNPIVADVVVLAFQRDRSDWNYRGWSPARNSFFEYSGYLAVDRAPDNGWPWVRHLARLGKKYPVRIGGRTVLLRLGVGVLWEWLRRFDRTSRRFAQRESSRLEWLIQPNVEF